MKNKTKLCRIAVALATAVYCVCVFAACGGERERYLYIRNTYDEEITVEISYSSQEYRQGHLVTGGTTFETIHSQTIPAGTTVAFTISEKGYYCVSASATSKYAYWGGNDYSNDILVIF